MRTHVIIWSVQDQFQNDSLSFSKPVPFQVY